MEEFAAQLGPLNMLDVDNAARAQINMDDLASSFQSYAIAADSPPAACHMGPNTKHHQLVIVYPCTGILPQGAELALEVPCHISQREQPKKGAFFEKNYPEVMMRLPTPADVAHAGIPQCEQKHQLESMIERLTLTPGFSTLNAVSYYTAEMQTAPTYRFELKTHWVTSSPSPLSEDEIQIIRVDAAEWYEICDQRAKVKWVKVLESHFNRGTDLSHLRVLERLRQYSPDFARHEVSLCDSLFDRAPYESVNNVLKIRMSTNGVRRVTVDSDQDVHRLPCGHQFMCNETYLMCVMSEEDCLAARCPECDQKVLHRDSDMVRVAIVHDRCAREQYKCDHALWKQITAQFEQEVHVGPASHATRFSVQCKDFRDAIIKAMGSFRLPSTVMPHETSHFNYPETLLIRDRRVGNLS
ncbi:hypothetical protein BST61_g1574 [Cercospora zeina]